MEYLTKQHNLELPSECKCTKSYCVYLIFCGDNLRSDVLPANCEGQDISIGGSFTIFNHFQQETIKHIYFQTLVTNTK